MVAQPTTDPAIRDELQRGTTTPPQSNFFLISNLKVGIGYLEPVKKKTTRIEYTQLIATPTKNPI